MNVSSKSLLGRIDEIDSKVVKLFGSLGSSQLTFRPNADRWSIAECLDHILRTNLCYFEEFKVVSVGNYRNSLWKRLNPFTKTIGRSMIKTLGPERSKTFSSPKLFIPEHGKHDGIIDRFLTSQETLKDYISRLHGSKKIIIYSPVSAVITLHIEHAFQILVGHEERHLLQAEGILNEKDFPNYEN